MTTPLSQQQRPLSREDALKRAAAIVNGTSAVTPVPTLLNLSTATIQARDTAAAWAKAQIGAIWATTNPYDDGQVADFAARSAQVMQAAQNAAGRTAAIAQSLQLRSIGMQAGTADPTLPLDVRGSSATIADGTITLHARPVTVDYDSGPAVRVTADDMTTEAVFQRPAETFRYVAAEGDKAGLRWIDDAKAQSNLRISNLVDDNLMLTQRLAQQEVLAQVVNLDRPGPKIIGYRRVIHPELSETGTCGMCIAAADRIYHIKELMPLHFRCKCTVAAITADHDPGDDANSIDLKTLYEHAGGKTVSHLKRTRYDVDEHGELGPVLVPKAKYKPQTKTGKPFQSSGTPRGELKRRRAALKS